MTEQRITLATGTPRPSARDLARFRLLVEPERRTRRPDAPRATVGDVLDARIPRDYSCAYRGRWYKASTETVGIMWRAECGRRDCPACVVAELSIGAGAAWASWRGRADWEVLEDGGTSGWSRAKQQRELGVYFRGPQATAGALAVPGDGARWVFWPAARGSDPDAELVRALRGIVIAGGKPSGGRGQMDHFGEVPRRLTDDQLKDAAIEAGFDFSVFGERRAEARGVTPEQNQEFVRILREA